MNTYGQAGQAGQQSAQTPTLNQALAQQVATGVRNAAHEVAETYEKIFVEYGIDPLTGPIGEMLKEQIELTIGQIFLTELVKAISSDEDAA
jgi:hypothetical protein